MIGSESSTSSEKMRCSVSPQSSDSESEEAPGESSSPSPDPLMPQHEQLTQELILGDSSTEDILSSGNEGPVVAEEPSQSDPFSIEAAPLFPVEPDGFRESVGGQTDRDSAWKSDSDDWNFRVPKNESVTSSRPSVTDAPSQNQNSHQESTRESTLDPPTKAASEQMAPNMAQPTEASRDLADDGRSLEALLKAIDEKVAEEEVESNTVSEAQTKSSVEVALEPNAHHPLTDNTAPRVLDLANSNIALPSFSPVVQRPATAEQRIVFDAASNGMDSQTALSSPTRSLDQRLPPQPIMPHPTTVGHPPYLPPAAYAGYAMMAAAAAPPVGRRRKITLRLHEDESKGHRRTGSFFRRSFRNFQDIDSEGIDRGSVTVSWFEGTSSLELQEHVRKSVKRKLRLPGNVRLDDMRIIDETIDPPEEIVLSAFIPDGSEFLLRYTTRESRELSTTLKRLNSGPPLSPSAAPSPFPSETDLAGLNTAQLQVLGAHLQGLQPLSPIPQTPSAERDVPRTVQQNETVEEKVPVHETLNEPGKDDAQMPWRSQFKPVDDPDAASKASTDLNEIELMSMSPEEQVEARLRQLTDLLVSKRIGKGEERQHRRQEKKQVIFVLANYFVLFLSLIAILAEIQARAPRWMAWMETNLESVQSCATDQDSLFECVSNGDFSGLIASFILWFGRSAATKRIFLLGFESPKRLWTVVYEALVTAFCWGISYIFIRRGMNPDTRPNFLHKYWKDAVYGSLAGFNASFLKAVLKNLIPQEALEDALQDRQLKILSWLPSFR